jgi:RNA polymerase-binding transcription factor DksA
VTTTQTFTPSQLRELRTEMEEELAWLLLSLTNKRSNTAASSNDASTAPSERDKMEQLLRDRAQRRLAAILASLERLDKGGYGECASCGRRIPYSRLTLMPESMYCVTCGGQLGFASPQPVG